VHFKQPHAAHVVRVRRRLSLMTGASSAVRNFVTLTQRVQKLTLIKGRVASIPAWKERFGHTYLMLC